MKEPNFIRQVVGFSNCDWVHYLTLEEIKNLCNCVTPNGAYYPVKFDPEVVSHGDDKWHRAYTDEYVEFCRVAREAGLTKEWEVIKNAKYPSPLGQDVMRMNGHRKVMEAGR